MKLDELITESEEVITYSVTFEIVTPESAENGEPEEQGFLDKDLESDFEDMVGTLEGTEPSNYPPSAENASSTWYTKYDVDVDYESGSHESNSYHGKTNRDRELMFKAWQAGNRS